MGSGCVHLITISRGRLSLALLTFCEANRTHLDGLFGHDSDGGHFSPSVPFVSRKEWKIGKIRRILASLE